MFLNLYRLNLQCFQISSKLAMLYLFKRLTISCGINTKILFCFQYRQAVREVTMEYT